MPLAFWMLYLWLILLVSAWLACVIKIPARERKGLLPVGAAVILLAAVLFGGNRVLAQFGLTWWMWPRYCLCVLLWVCGLIVGVLTVRDTPKLVKGFGTAAKWAVRVLAAFSLMMTMWFGTVFGGLWAVGPGETVGVYHGETVVQGKWVWLDVSYELYEYHGPLVRGAKGFVSSVEPFLEGVP